MINNKNNIWRRTVFTVLLLCSFAVMLCGCGKGGDAANVTIGDVVDIPDNGVIKAEQFEAFAETDRTVLFKGKSGDILYEWEFNGTNIHNPVEMNLSVDFITEGDELSHIKEIAGNAPYAVGMKFNSEETVAVPVLTIEINEKWDADTAVFCFEQDGKAMKVSDAVISASEDSENERTLLSVKVADFKKTYYIVAGKSGQAELTEDSDEVSSNQETESTDSNDEVIKTDSSADGVSSPAASGSKEEGISGTTDSTQTSSPGTSTSNNDVTKPAANGETKPAENGDSKLKCTISINCSAILSNMGSLKAGKEEFVPSDGWILKPVSIEFSEGESVFDVLKRVCRNNGIQIEHEYFPVYESTYIEGINQLYERDCGPASGWKYSVNGWQPNYGCDKYKLSGGDKIEWTYTCSY